LLGKVTVYKGDYHHLDSLFSSAQYDRVLFLESLGHADSPEKVIRASHKILKVGGCIYIKDFFQKESDDASFLKKCQKVVANINQYYAYNTLELHLVLSTLRKLGFEIIYLKKPEFQDDISVRLAFETQNNINVFGDYAPFVPTDWYEIFAKKI
jgi:ubiquinone/menaquinone biosynthesis C-methylase UbiE